MSDPTTPAGWGIQLSKLWLACGQGFPIKVRDIALEVTKARFAEPVGKIVEHGVPGIDGMLSRRSQRDSWCISYDGAVSLPGRINFTLAHEFGHYLLHRQLQDEFRCGQSEMLDYNSADARKREAEANKFASYLLMPADDFRSQIAGQPVNVALIGQCAERYETTFTATALKWLEVTNEIAMVVVARDEFVCWSYSSINGRRRGIYLPPGTPVPPASLDWLGQTGVQNSKDTTRRVPPGVWHDVLDAEESVIVSDRYEQMIFLVRFPEARIVLHEEEPENDMTDFFAERVKGLGWKK